MQVKIGQKADLNVFLLQHHLDSVNLTVNENTGSNPVIGVPEDKLDDDKQHIDSFAFVAVKTEIKVSFDCLLSSIIFVSICKFVTVTAEIPLPILF